MREANDSSRHHVLEVVKLVTWDMVNGTLAAPYWRAVALVAGGPALDSSLKSTEPVSSILRTYAMAASPSGLDITPCAIAARRRSQTTSSISTASVLEFKILGVARRGVQRPVVVSSSSIRSYVDGAIEVLSLSSLLLRGRGFDTEQVNCCCLEERRARLFTTNPA